MKQFLIKRSGEKLILLLAGWSMDETPFVDIAEIPVVGDVSAMDILVCYDYRSLDFDSKLLANYSDITLVTWSMGVWVAEQIVFAENVTRFIAINGTGAPVDDRLGIPVDIFNGTLDTLNDSNLVKFNRRMSREGFAEFNARKPKRAMVEIVDELRLIGERSVIGSKGLVNWDVAVVSTRDYIFPAENMCNYWKNKGVDVVEIDAPHFPFRYLYE
ncbi:MAG: DUF452 family protein [Bacteroidales bacterium]